MIMQAARTARTEGRENTANETPHNSVPPQSHYARIAARPLDEEPWVERHEAIWLDGRVPHGYWDQPNNRRRFVRWLGQQLGIQSRHDWYHISTDDFKKNAGGGLLHHWRDSAISAVEDTYRDFDWKEWLFKVAPRRYWHDRRNHRTYMQWFGERLGIREPSDWYHVTNQDFRDHGGGAFLLCYDSTVSAAIKAYLPDYDWKEWMFDKTPKGFWDQRKNRRRYMLWLGNELGLKTREAWYALTTDDFKSNYGNQLLKRYGGSPVAALRDCFPRHTWHEWKFARVPAGFWSNLDNRRRYICWLGRKLKLKTLRDWRTVRRHDFVANCGGGLLFLYKSHWDVLTQCIPGLEREAAE